MGRTWGEKARSGGSDDGGGGEILTPAQEQRIAREMKAAGLNIRPSGTLRQILARIAKEAKKGTGR